MDNRHINYVQPQMHFAANICQSAISLNEADFSEQSSEDDFVSFGDRNLYMANELAPAARGYSGSKDPHIRALTLREQILSPDASNSGGVANTGIYSSTFRNRIHRNEC